MFLGSYSSPDFLWYEEIRQPHRKHICGDAECIFIGEILSTSEETEFAFMRFIQDLKPKHLLFLRGNYQTIVYLHDELWLFADLGNVRPIYYTKDEVDWIFSSHLSVLKQRMDLPLNSSWFFRSLSTGGFHIETETPYKDINRIPGGFGLHLSQKGVRLFQSWDVDQEDKLSWEEASSILYEELTASVLLRCEGKRITTDLSGGLDSSTLTWIASKKYPVTSITIIGKEEHEDSKIAKDVASQRKNIHHVLFHQEEFPSIFSGMDQIYTDYPIPFYWSASNAKKIFSWARENKSDIHFSGEGGDTVLGADFTYLIDLIHQGKWKTFLSHARGWADYKKQSPWSWIVAAILLSLHIPYAPKQRHPLVNTQNQASWFNFSTIVNKGYYSKYRGVSDTLQGIHYLGYVSQGLKDLAEQEQVQLGVPFLDHNVIRICMRVPLEEKMPPNELKPLLKRAFHHDLPLCLLERNSKGDYTSDVYEGMKQNFSWFWENFKSMYLADLGFIDLKKFQECFHRLYIGTPVKLWEFQQTLSLELWLRKSSLQRNGRNHYETLYS